MMIVGGGSASHLSEGRIDSLAADSGTNTSSGREAGRDKGKGVGDCVDSM